MIAIELVKELMEGAGIEIEIDEKALDKPFGDIGLDSLDLYNFLTEVENKFGKSIEDKDLEKLKTIGDILKFCND